MTGKHLLGLLLLHQFFHSSKVVAMDLKYFKLSNTVSHQVSKLSEDEITRFENNHLISFPPDYKKLVLEPYNGGELPDSAHVSVKIEYDSKKSGPSSFQSEFEIFELYSLEKLEPHTYPYTEGQPEEKEDVKEKYKYYLRIGNGMNCDYYLGVGPENYGQVFLWIGQYEEKLNPIKISDTFLGFIEALQIDPDVQSDLDVEFLKH